MKLTDQVISLEHAQRLKELGVEQESLWYHFLIHNNWHVMEKRMPAFRNIVPNKQISAFTVAELGEMLPDSASSYKDDCEFKWLCDVVDIGGRGYRTHSGADTEANARAKALIWLIENGHHDALLKKYDEGV